MATTFYTRALGTCEGGVELLHELGCLLPAGILLVADDEAVWPHKVLNRSTLFQELWVGGHCEVDFCFSLGQHFMDGLFNFFSGPHGYRRFINNDFEIGHVSCDVSRCGQDVLQICAAIFVGWRTYRNELHLTVCDALCNVGGKAEAACSNVLLDKLR